MPMQAYCQGKPLKAKVYSDANRHCLQQNGKGYEFASGSLEKAERRPLCWSTINPRSAANNSPFLFDGQDQPM
jgi:hypothetical protein